MGASPVEIGEKRFARISGFRFIKTGCFDRLVKRAFDNAEAEDISVLQGDWRFNGGSIHLGPIMRVQIDQFRIPISYRTELRMEGGNVFVVDRDVVVFIPPQRREFLAESEVIPLSIRTFEN